MIGWLVSQQVCNAKPHVMMMNKVDSQIPFQHGQLPSDFSHLFVHNTVCPEIISIVIQYY